MLAWRTGSVGAAMKRRTLLTITSPSADAETFTLDTLADAPDDVICFTRPRVAPDVAVRLRGTDVTASRGGAAPVVLFETGDEASLHFFNACNGEQTLAEVARNYAGSSDMSHADSLRAVISFARQLYRSGILVPVNAARSRW